MLLRVKSPRKRLMHRSKVERYSIHFVGTREQGLRALAIFGLITSSTLSRGWHRLQELARDRHYSSTKSAAAHKAAFTKAMNATVR